MVTWLCKIYVPKVDEHRQLLQNQKERHKHMLLIIEIRLNICLIYSKGWIFWSLNICLNVVKGEVHSLHFSIFTKRVMENNQGGIFKFTYSINTIYGNEFGMLSLISLRALA